MTGTSSNISVIHRVAQKMSSFKIWSLYFSINPHQIFNILVSTPHNMGCIKGDRHKNFKDPMWVYLRKRRKKIRKFFSGHSLNTLLKVLMGTEHKTWQKFSRPRVVFPVSKKLFPPIPGSEDPHQQEWKLLENVKCSVMKYLT